MNGFRTWNVGKIRRKSLQVLAMGRTLLVLAGLSILFFIVLGASGMAEKSLNTSPVSSMKGLASSLSSRFFVSMLGMEVPHLKQEQNLEPTALSGKKMTEFVFQMLTNVNPSDPKSLVAREVPGLDAGNPILLRGGKGEQPPTAPEDYRPSPAETDHSGKGIEKEAGKGKTDPSQGGNAGKKPDSSSAGKKSTKKVVLIYHSHPHESYNPLLGTNSANPSTAAKSKNVGAVGDWVAKELEKKGIGTLHSFQDYMSTVQSYNYNYSYKYSKVTVKEALAQNNQLDYLIDIHRDSQRHKKTTTTINNVGYAQVYFIIGHANPNWRKNEAFASSIHDRLEKEYPGLSRGIWGKTSAQGNGEYNQSLSPNSVLIEIGGVDNTKEELERSSKALAAAIADVYFAQQKAEKANAAPEKKGHSKSGQGDSKGQENNKGSADKPNQSNQPKSGQ